MLEFKTGFDEQRKKLSKVDLELQSILHEMEDVRFNAVEGYRYANSIQELRVKRRLIKVELDQYQRVNDQVARNPSLKLEQAKKGIVVKEEKG